jgi:tRNA threonylcarbamoyladenosine biosynthesis protein TsaB
MLILAIRTDKPEAELGLYDNDRRLTTITWQAHRQLAETIHLKIAGLLKSQQKQLSDIEGIVIFKGPGSFTGLRIGLSVANALADALTVPIIGAQGEDWQQQGQGRLVQAENDRIVQPEYGAPVHITQPKK